MCPQKALHQLHQQEGLNELVQQVTLKSSNGTVLWYLRCTLDIYAEPGESVDAQSREQGDVCW